VRIEGLAELGGLSAGVAHEINNPIGIIKAYAEFLLKSSPQDDPRREDFETIRAEAERCEGIVRRMLDFSNAKPQQVGEVSLAELVRETAALVFDERLSHQINLHLSIPEQLPLLFADAAQLRQALLNVLMNARQAVESLEGTEVKREVRISLSQLKGLRAPLELRVEDTGPGITREVAAKAFEPFFTTRAKGTGLGLAITRRIIESHQGTITLEPLPTGGTRCSVSLPIREEI
ncbi:MAG: ATP-binding protein, partial [Candidatus Sumerlaeia bacterium]|nr:ATP-binding protein [Candidatus Sumerlaeia bacterium]